MLSLGSSSTFVAEPSLIAGFEVKSGEVIGRCGRPFGDQLGTLHGGRGGEVSGTVYIDWDNLNIYHDGKRIAGRGSTNDRHRNSFVFVYTPLHASWANQIETFFSIVQRQCPR